MRCHGNVRVFGHGINETTSRPPLLPEGRPPPAGGLAAGGLAGSGLAGTVPAWADERRGVGVLLERPTVTHGVQVGDVNANSAVIWGRADRPSSILIELSTRESFHDARKVFGPAATADTDFTAQHLVRGLPPGQRITHRVSFVDPGSGRRSEPDNQAAAGPDRAFFGAEQVSWLVRQLRASRATWKVIAADMPFSLIVPDSPGVLFEAVAQGDNGAPLGRELEVAGLLSAIRASRTSCG
jgi:phosphodiesterase/alkaline phosphatase D-like protein